MDTKKSGFNTKQVHAGAYKDEFNSATVPIYQTSTFGFRDAQHGADCFAGKDKGYIYTRIGNPTINALENNLAILENGFGGIATSSGMGAVTTVFMALLSKGDHIICSRAVYGPVSVFLENHLSRFGVESTFVDTSDFNSIKDAVKSNTKMLYVETPANPTMQISDINKCSVFAKSKGIYLVVDNTFCSPYLQSPLDLGADVVLHSLTKFINGHADIVGGVIITKTEDLYKKIRPLMVYMGCNIDPHQAYMVLRGVKTLSLRMERAQENAMKIAKFLESHSKIEWIKYPGLESHPQYELAKTQMRGPGAMISFEVKGGIEAGKIIMNNVKVATLAVSLGGIETLIQKTSTT